MVLLQAGPGMGRRDVEPEVGGKGVVNVPLLLRVADRLFFRGKVLVGVAKWHGLLRVVRATIPCDAVSEADLGVRDQC